MRTSKKVLQIMKNQLSGSYKRNGVNIWRFVFSAMESVSGREKKLFVEIAMINPYLNPSEVVLGFKPRVNISSDDLQNVLAGTISAQKIQSEKIETPSYVAIRAGILGNTSKQLCRYFSINEVKISSHSFEIDAGSCHFDENKLVGSIECVPSEISAHPEYLCESGIITWNLRYDMSMNFDSGYAGKEETWKIPGAKTNFAGNVVIDGKEYTVLPKKSYGYIDRVWGKKLPSSWFHISSSNIASIITGKALLNSCFAVQGVYGDNISINVNFEGTEYVFTPVSSKGKYKTIFDCSQMPENEDGERLHWSVSSGNKKIVLDIDVFCPAEQMYVRSLELPEGGRKTLRMLSGGSGTGEIRVYKKHRKNNLELIEHCRIASALCEYGQMEEQEL